MKKEILGKCMLLMSALIWGSSFIVMKNAVDFLIEVGEGKYDK